MATRAKLHMGHAIYDNWCFSWIPLSKRCRIDLEIIRFWHVQMKWWICFNHGQIVKVGQQSYVGSEAQQSCLFILNVLLLIDDVLASFGHTHLHTSLSFSLVIDWIRISGPLSPHVRNCKRSNFWIVWPALTATRADNRWVVWPYFDWAQFDYFEGCFILLFGGWSWLKLTDLLRVKFALLTNVDFFG